MNRMKMKTEILPAEGEAIAKAADLLRRGELVALPTETVYGIAADARNGAAVAKIFVAKGRPQDNPLIVHVTGPEMLPGLVSEVPERAQLLMAAFCPGPLTIIMPRGPEVAAECCAGLDTVGIRMPSHPVARAVIAQSGCAFAAPSANLSGKPSPTNAQDVFTDMDGRLPLILDGGECDVGVESTVISVVGEKPTLFRPGHITLEDLERALGEEVEVSKAILEKLPEVLECDVVVNDAGHAEFVLLCDTGGQGSELCVDAEVLPEVYCRAEYRRLHRREVRKSLLAVFEHIINDSRAGLRDELLSGILLEIPDMRPCADIRAEGDIVDVLYAVAAQEFQHVAPAAVERHLD